MAGKQSTCRSALKSQATVVLHLEYRHTEGTKGKIFQSSKSLSKEIHQSASSYFFPLLLSIILQKEEFLIFEIQEVVEKSSHCTVHLES